MSFTECCDAEVKVFLLSWVVASDGSIGSFLRSSDVVSVEVFVVIGGGGGEGGGGAAAAVEGDVGADDSG